MSVGTYTAKPGDCVLALVDGRVNVRAHCALLLPDGPDKARAICWILREDAPGIYVALTRKPKVTVIVEFQLVTVRDPRPFSLRDAEGNLMSPEAREHLCAAIRALAPLIP